MKRAEIKQLCQTIKQYSNGPKPPTIDFLAKVTKKPRSTVGKWRKRMYDEKILESEYRRGDAVEYYLFNKHVFRELETIQNFEDRCRIDKKNPSRYTSPLYTVCKSLNVHPNDLIQNRETIETYFSKFENIWGKVKPGKTTERYAKALRKFAKYHGIDLKDSTAIPGSSQSKGDYATVHLTDDEFTQGLKYFDNEDYEYQVCFGLFHEIFARPDMMWSWTPNVEIQYKDVDDDSYEYGSCRVFENKQEKYYDKLILDPRVLAMAQELDPNAPLIPKEHRGDMERNMAEHLRQFYMNIGKIDREKVESSREKGIEPYETGQPGWLYYNRPIYTLRHSAATMWVRRLNYNVGLVAAMGWEDPKTLTTFYARTTTNNIMDAGICYYCKPPKKPTDKASFCGAPHCTAWLARTYGGEQTA